MRIAQEPEEQAQESQEYQQHPGLSSLQENERVIQELVTEKSRHPEYHLRVIEEAQP